MGPTGAGGNVPPHGAAGDPRRTAVPEGAGDGGGGRQALPTSRDWRAQGLEPGRARQRGDEAGGGPVGGLRGRKAASRASRVPGLRAQAGGARLRGPARARPRRRGEGGPGGRGPRRPRSQPRPLWAAHPPPHPHPPPAARPAGPRGAGQTPDTHTPAARGRAGPRAIRSLPMFRSNHFSPGVHFSWGTTEVSQPSGLTGGL